MRTAAFDPDQLERLMASAFELLGRPEGQAQELARSILRAGQLPQSGDQAPQDHDPK
jgi:LDH2 family malate/lactate/ureidoglycolate dehydrogenase